MVPQKQPHLLFYSFLLLLETTLSTCFFFNTNDILKKIFGLKTNKLIFIALAEIILDLELKLDSIVTTVIVKKNLQFRNIRAVDNRELGLSRQEEEVFEKVMRYVDLYCMIKFTYTLFEQKKLIWYWSKARKPVSYNKFYV